MMTNRKYPCYALAMLLTLMAGPAAFTQDGDAPEIRLHLSVDYAEQTELFADQPAIIRLSLSNPGAAYRQSANQAASAYLQELEARWQSGDISDAYYQEESLRATQQMRNVGQATLGSNALPWFSAVSFFLKLEDSETEVALPLSLLPASDPPPILELGPDTYVTAAFDLSAGKVSALSSGEHVLLARLAGVKSNPVELEIDKKALPKKFKGKSDLLLRLGDYYLAAEQWASAVEVGEALLEEKDGRVDGHMLIGQGLAGQGRCPEALPHFQQALDAFHEDYPDIGELPEVILHLIELCSGGGVSN